MDRNMLEKYKRIFKENIPKAPAYWISPVGKILPIMDDEKHIDQIIKNPKAFYLTIEEIQKIYDKHHEELGSEGKAREEIIKNLIFDGWVRIRHYTKQDMFTVNLNRLNKKNKNYLYQWAKDMEKQGLKYSQVNIDLPNQVMSYSMDDIAKDVLFNESMDSGDILQVVESVFEL